MQVNNLIVGQSYKYKELCELIGIEPKTGNTKNSQLKELATVVNYEKNGVRFLIKEIYREKKEKMDKRRNGNNNEISKHIQYSLACLLSKKPAPKDGGLGLSLNRFQLYEYLGLSNDKFGNAFINKKSHADNLYVSEMAVIECMNYTYHRLYTRLDSAFESFMKKRSGFIINKGYKLKFSDIVYKTADSEEMGMIADVENKVLTCMGLKNKRDLLFVKKDEENKFYEFKNQVISKLKEDFPLHFESLKSYSDAFVFHYTQRAAIRIKEQMEQEFGFSEETIKADLNNLLSDSLDQTIVKRHEKAKEENKPAFGDVIIADKFIDKYRIDDRYIEEQKRVKDSVIKIKTEQLSFDTIQNEENTIIENSEEYIPF